MLAYRDDEVEGHAISLRFPTPAEAQAFRRRVIAGGVLAATVALAAPGAAAGATFIEPLPGIVDAFVQPTEEVKSGGDGGPGYILVDGEKRVLPR